MKFKNKDVFDNLIAEGVYPNLKILSEKDYAAKVETVILQSIGAPKWSSEIQAEVSKLNGNHHMNIFIWINWNVVYVPKNQIPF